MRIIPRSEPRIGPKDEPALILMLGHDAALLETRQWVLQSRGYRVVAAENVSALEKMPRSRPVSVLLLCQTLSPQERDGAIAIARTRWPGCRSLALERETGRAPTGILGQLLHTQSGPSRLISMVSELLHGERAERAS